MDISNEKSESKPKTSRHPAQTSSSTGKQPERRQLFAQDTRLGPDGPLVFIKEGDAPALRPECFARYLICPVPGCTDPRYTTRGGSKRDHFVHLHAPVDSLHSPERWFHFVSKHLISSWLKAQAPNIRIQVDDEAVDNGQIPDVLAAYPDGRRFAFEIQYSPITRTEWLRRHRGYEAQGIVDIWLFGHIPPHLSLLKNTDPDAEPIYALTPLAEELLDKGYHLHWINPNEHVIHTIDKRSCHHSPSSVRRYVKITSDPLCDCRIIENCFVTPTDIHYKQELAEKRELQKQEEARRQERQQEEEARQREQQLKKEAWQHQQEFLKMAAWEPIKASIISRFGSIPSIIEEPVKSERAIFKYLPQHWRYLFYSRFIKGKVGKSFSFPQAYATFVEEQRHHEKAVSYALSAFLYKLRREGFVVFKNNRYWIDSEISVLKDQI